MSINHVSPHKYGDRKALGIYRMLATFTMTVLFSFLTVYEVIITKERFYFTLQWWVSLGTLLFFALSLVGFQAYMGAKPPNARTAEDGSHPFYDWKLVTSGWSLALQASIHLVVLEHLQPVDDLVVNDYLDYAFIYTPIALLMIDFLLNRIYLPLTIVVNYSYWAYAFALLNFLVRSDVENLFPLPEIQYFEIQPRKLSWVLPIAIAASVYLLQRVKFWYIGEGDLVFDFDSWAKNADERMQHLENDGVREEESFKFNVASGDNYVSDAAQIDYSDPKNADKQFKGRQAHNKGMSVRHKRLTNEFKRQAYYLEKKADLK